MASLLSRNCQTVIWARRQDVAQEIASSHRNSWYLPDFELPEQLEATASLEEALCGAELVVMAVPSHGFREILVAAAPSLGERVPLVSLAKGLEVGSLSRMTEVISDVAPGRPAGVLTGPNLAAEVMAGQPSASVLALSDSDVAAELQPLFSTELFRVYTNTDVVGCEIAGALKNVIAIAAGIALGLGFGDNTRAALVTRGLAELGRLGVALGADSLTFGGLAGMGDLVATCMSPRSRNRHVGEQLGRGRALEDIVAEMRMVAEGVKTSGAAVELARRHAVEMPIAEQVVEVISGRRRPVEVIPTLMLRRPRAELDWSRRAGPSLESHAAAAPAVPPADGPASRERADAEPGHEPAMQRLRDFLRARGVSEEDIREAEAEDSLDLLAVDTALIPRPPALTAVEVSERSGFALDRLHRVWRAMGFPEVGNDEPIFSEIDVEGFRVIQQLLVLVTANADTAVQLMRVMGSAMARVAEAEVAASSDLMGLTDGAQVADMFIRSAEPAIAAIGRLLEYVWRRHLEVASHRVILQYTGGRLAVSATELTVGFADLVGFTVLSQELDDESLASLVERFEIVAHDIVTSYGGRLVKMIGDEAMFVIDDVARAARIGLELSEAYSDDDVLSDVRVGLASGAVLARDGDYYGQVVNLSSRIVNIARPGSVLVSDEVHSALAADSEFAWRPLRPRSLKDIGRVQLWSLRRPSGARRRDRRVWSRASTRAAR